MKFIGTYSIVKKLSQPKRLRINCWGKRAIRNHSGSVLAHNKQMAQLAGKDFSPLSSKRYKMALEHTRKFIQRKYKSPVVKIEKVDYTFISDFEFWFKSVQNCNHNSTMNYLACLKKIVLIYVKKGLLRKKSLCRLQTQQEGCGNTLSHKARISCDCIQRYT